MKNGEDTQGGGGKDTEKALLETMETADVDDHANKRLIYGVTDNPPIHITVICALQQGLLSLASNLVVSLLVAEAVCASNNSVFKARLLSSTLFMDGVTTIAMVLLGVRLPLFQGAAAGYVIPLLLIGSMQSSFCSSLNPQGATRTDSLALNNTVNTTQLTPDESMDLILYNVRALQGSLMAAGIIHALLGATGVIGFLLRFIGPITIVPCMILIGIFIVNPVLNFVEASWGIAISTMAVAVILSLYLANHDMPVPVWTPSGGFRVIRYPLHQVFSILISIIVNWALSGVLTAAGVFTDDPTDKGFQARTDARSGVIADSQWFLLPYPGQYGMVSFSSVAFVACLIATLLSVLDSIGDYYACARVCGAPVPPAHAVNRGILTEGICSFLSGTVGCGHATTTYGGNIGSIGVTKVASRSVFVCVGLLYIVFGIIGKFSAIFITIPYPVLGGAATVMFGIFFGIIISNLQVVSLSSSRNLDVIGLSVFVGFMVPTWAKRVKHPINTGNESFDNLMSMILGNPNLVGTLLACILDNTVPGTGEERGIAAWHVSDGDEAGKPLDKNLYSVGYDIYYPILPRRLLRMRIMKYVPFLPYIKHTMYTDTNSKA